MRHIEGSLLKKVLLSYRILKKSMLGCRRNRAASLLGALKYRPKISVAGAIVQ
jgi:hypothetical protein